MKNKAGGKGGGASGGGGGGTGGRESVEDELLKEAMGDDDQGDGDGSENEGDEEDADGESDGSDDSGDDDGGEGEEADGSGDEDAGEGAEAAEEDEADGDEVDGEDDEDGDEEEKDGTGGLRELVLSQNQQINKLVKTLSEKAEAPKAMSDEEWAKIEEDTGMKRAGVKFLAEKILGPSLKKIVDTFGSRLAKMESNSAFTAMAGNPKFKDIGAYRGRMEKILQDYSPEARNNPGIMRLAYFAAKGMGIKKAVAAESQRREVRKKISVTKRPGGGKGGEGRGGKSVTLTPIQKQAAKLAGMSEKEYISNMRPRG